MVVGSSSSGSSGNRPKKNPSSRCWGVRGRPSDAFCEGCFTPLVSRPVLLGGVSLGSERIPARAQWHPLQPCLGTGALRGERLGPEAVLVDDRGDPGLSPGSVL